MGAAGNDDAVQIQKGKKAGDPHVVTVNCPDRTGLACDICRIILEFELRIFKGDVSTDGKWCYLVLWLAPLTGTFMRWPNLRDRLLIVCPSSCSVAFYLNQPPPPPVPSPVYLLKILCLDRKGLLHDVTKVLCELELTIQRVKVTKTPDDTVLDLFFVTDNLDELHTPKRQEETLGKVRSVLGGTCSCEVGLAECQRTEDTCTLSPSVSNELLRSEDERGSKEFDVKVDNSLSPAHTLLQIKCLDHKGMFYDIMRMMKDFDIKIAHGRFSKETRGTRELDLFVQGKQGGKFVDAGSQRWLCESLEMEVVSPVRVAVVNRGPDTELLVANPVEVSGRGRPRVLYDVTRALKVLGICVFSAEIGRFSEAAREWEVYRFLMEECVGQSDVRKDTVVRTVTSMLMGWS